MTTSARSFVRLPVQASCAALLAVLGCMVFCAAAGAITYAPVDQPGPALGVAQSELQASIVCSPNVGHSTREPVLFVPGTGATFAINFQWNLAAALTKVGTPWCGVSPPHAQLGDLQTAAEYDVYAIRYLYRRSGRKIAIVGHSQGGMQPRWALRFWPDTRKMVAAMIGIAPDNQGVSAGVDAGPTVTAACNAVGDCPVDIWQQLAGSNFIRALNSGQEMFPGIAYTVIYSTNDALIYPQDARLDGPGNYSMIALQDVCPGHIANHLQDGTYDPVTWALVLDAVTHPGPAQAARIPHSVCSQLVNPELNPVTAGADFATAAAQLAANIAAKNQFSPREPPPACYVTASCPASVPLQIAVAQSRATRGRRTTLHVHVTVTIDQITQPVPDVTIRVGPFSGETNDRGQLTLRLRLSRRSTSQVLATATEFLPAHATIRGA